MPELHAQLPTMEVQPSEAREGLNMATTVIRRHISGPARSDCS